MKEEKIHPSPLQSWLIWSSGGLFFLLGFFHRVAPAVLHRELTVDFSLSASSLGALTSLYYYSYTAMQIPTGLLADLWGPRRLLAFGLISTAISSAFFEVYPIRPKIFLCFIRLYLYDSLELNNRQR